MLPGCAEPLPSFKEGQILAVFVRGNPAAVVSRRPPSSSYPLLPCPLPSPKFLSEHPK